MPDIEFFFDFSSPYSYLASTQIARVAERAGVRFHPKPFVLGAIFKAAGNLKPADIPAKAPYMLRDLKAWARDYGVPFTFNENFPLNAVKAERMMLAIGDRDAEWKFAQAVFHATWAENRDTSDPAVLSQIASAQGLDAPVLLARIEQQDVKDLLRAYTESAIERGSFGAPTFFVAGQMFIGNDRLHFVERAARGERVHPDE